MVKDGWISSSYQEDTDNITDNNYFYHTKIADQQQAHHNFRVSINPEPKDTTSVWALYESKEKFIEMHF